MAAEISAPDSSDDTSIVEQGASSGKFHHGKNSAWTTAGIIIADVVGAGILGMPRGVRQFGWLAGAIIMATVLAANVHVSLLLWRVRMFYTPCKNANTYVHLCRGAFSRAPKLQRRIMLGITGISQYSFIFGTMSISLLSAAKGLGMVFYKQQICLPQWAAIAGAVLLPFAGTAREMGSYQSLVWINILTLCGTVLIPLLFYVFHGTEGIMPAGSEIVPIAPMTASGVVSGLSTFTFGMTSQFMLTEIIAEMKDPSELPKAYAAISAPFQLAAFLVAGLGGYYFLGDKVSGMINDNLPFNPAFQVAAACLVIHMLISYLIKGVVFCRAILVASKDDWADPEDPRKRAFAAWNIIVITALFCSWLIANLVPFFGDAVDLLGASVTPLSCFVVPILMFLRYYVDADDEEKPKIGAVEWFCLFCEMAMALVLMFFGTHESLVSIAENWSTYGLPFQCHCEGIWNTCGCSGDHIGMDMCHMIPGGN